jgi:hypothetical protein
MLKVHECENEVLSIDWFNLRKGAHRYENLNISSYPSKFSTHFKFRILLKVSDLGKLISQWL